MESQGDYQLLFSRLNTDVSDTDFKNINETLDACIECDPDIKEMSSYLECLSQPNPDVYSGI